MFAWPDRGHDLMLEHGLRKDSVFPREARGIDTHL